MVFSYSHMMKRRITLGIFVFLTLILGITFCSSRKSIDSDIPNKTIPQKIEVKPSHALQKWSSPYAQKLIRIDTDPIEDLKVINEMLRYYTLDPIKRLPMGTNQEITKALTHKKPNELPFLPLEHPAINDQGELTDRWKTPYFFHALSSSSIEVRSAGADRRMYTEDDIIWPKPNNILKPKAIFENSVNI